jgi:hypothetical protein
MNELRKLVRQIIKEARTKQPGDLSQQELIDLLDHVLNGGGVFDFTEKFAGSHAEILQRTDGSFSSKSKSSRAAGGGWAQPTGKAKQISDQMAALEISDNSRRFGFEFIDASERPDYINYLIGDQPVAVEYTGELEKSESESLNAAQSLVRFVSSEEVTHDDFTFSAEDVESLNGLSDELSSSSLKRADLKTIGSQISDLIASSISSSLLGGPIEGLMVTSPTRTFKIPNPQYSGVQRLQSPLYAMFSGRGGVSKKEIKSRIINASLDDRLLKDVSRYLESIADLPQGFRTFFTPEEAENILELIDSAASGDTTAGESLYVKLNRRINNTNLWVNT